MERYKLILLVLGFIACMLFVSYVEDPKDYEPSEAHLQVHEYVIRR